MNDMTPKEKMDKAVRQILYRAPFYGAMLTKMKIIEDPNCYGGTMCTDGKSIWWNPAFVDEHTWQSMAFVLMHEVDHKVQLDAWRMGARDPSVWNIAGDAVINRRLIDYCKTLPGSNVFCMPTDNKGAPVGILFDWVDSNMTKEVVYDKLKKDAGRGGSKPDQGAGGWRFGPGKGKGDLKAPPMGGVEEEQAASAALQDVIEAAMTAKLMGSLPGHVEKMITDLPAQLVDWKNELNREVRSLLGADDWSFRRPRRSGMYNGLILPTLHGNKTPHVCVIIDTSGSFTGYVAQAFAEIRAILVDCMPDKVTVLQADTEVQHEEEFTNAAEIGEPTWYGGGGTDFRPACARAIEIGASAVIFITDAYGTFPDEPMHNMIWCLIGQSAAPLWGKVIRVQP